MKDATIVQTDETTNEVSVAVKPFIDAYLARLQKAGHHILSSLPPVDDVSVQRRADFSAATQHCYQHFTEMFEVNVEKINTYVQEAWLQAAWSIEENGVSLTTRKSTAIAEWNSTWSLIDEQGIHF